MAAQALASAGLAAILGLPILLLASLVLGAPLAVPAAIASGYLATAHALASDRPQRAALIAGLVISALVGWLVLYLFESETPFSRTGIAAALMAPLFAAAPAFARSMIAPRATKAATGVSLSRAAALERAACLDRLAPSEPVLIADPEGCVLAATQAARRLLPLLPDAFEQPVIGLFDPTDMPKISDALQRCSARGEPVQVELADGGEGRPAKWIFSPYEDGAVSLRFMETVSGQPPASSTDETEPAATALKEISAAPPSPASDMGEAVAFALQRVRAQAEAKRIVLASRCDGGLDVACDRQVGRRVAHLAIDAALSRSAGDTIRVDVRKLRGIVLLKVATDIATDRAATDVDSIELATLRTLVDEAGGTLVVNLGKEGLELSVRLALADVGAASERMRERAKAA